MKGRVDLRPLSSIYYDKPDSIPERVVVFLGRVCLSDTVVCVKGGRFKIYLERGDGVVEDLNLSLPIVSGGLISVEQRGN